jgi:hypothetical protein
MREELPHGRIEVQQGVVRYFDAGALRSTRPAWARERTSAAVTVLVTEPMPAMASGTSGTPAPSAPKTPAHDPSGVTTAAETPFTESNPDQPSITVSSAACSAARRAAENAVPAGSGNGSASGGMTESPAAVGDVVVAVEAVSPLGSGPPALLVHPADSTAAAATTAHSRTGTPLRVLICSPPRVCSPPSAVAGSRDRAGPWVVHRYGHRCRRSCTLWC